MLKLTTFAVFSLLAMPAVAADYLCKDAALKLADRPALLKEETFLPTSPTGGVLAAAGPATQMLAATAVLSKAGTASQVGVRPGTGIAADSLLRLASGPPRASSPAATGSAIARTTVAGPGDRAAQLQAMRAFTRSNGAFAPRLMDSEKWEKLLAESLRKFDKRDLSKHTPPKDSQRFDYGKLPPPPPGSAMAKLVAAVQPAAAGQPDCSNAVTAPWRNAETALDDATHGAVYENVATMLADPVQFQQDKPDLFLLVQEYVKQARSMLQACYISAETSDFVKRHGLLRQLGTLTTDTTPFCTAMAFGAKNYVLTARHCFSNVSKDTGQLWFVPAEKKDRYEVCSIVGTDALSEDAFANINRDQVLVRVADGGATPAKLAFLRSDKLLTLQDYKTRPGIAPTLLHGVSYFPLASKVLPATYASGFVQGSVKVCAAASKLDGCFSHNCAAIAGGSGSPVFVASDQQLILAGTHVGLSNSTGQACKSPAGVRHNTAVYIDPRFSGLEFAAGQITNP